VWIAQTLLVAITWVLVLTIAQRVFSSRTFALVSLALVVCLLPSQVYARYLYSETFSAFLLTAIALVWSRAQEREGGYDILLGVLAAALGLCRVEFMLLPAVIGVWLWVRKRSRRTLALFVGGWLVVVAPWTLRNAWSVGEWNPSTKGSTGAALWIGTWGQEGMMWDTKRGDTKIPYPILPPEAYDSPEEGRRAWTAVYAYIKFVLDDPATTIEGRSPDSVLLEIAWERIRRDPLKWLRLRLKEAPLLWQPSFANWGSWIVNPFAMNAFFGWVFFALTMGSIALGWQDPKYHPLWIPVAYYAFVHFPFHVEIRYGVPMYPLVMLLSVGFFHQLRERRKNWLRDSMASSTRPAPLAE
jgi:hypothetical protein